MKKILFVANNPTALSGMTFLITEMKKKYSISPILVCESCCSESGEYEVINLSPDIKAGGIKKTPTEFYNQKEKTFIKQLRKFLNHYHELGVIDKKSKEILKRVRPDAIVVYSDRMAGILQGFLKNAKGIPLIEVPIAVNPSSLELFMRRYYNAELRVTNRFWDINRLILLLNNNWGYEFEGEKRLFYPAGYTLAGYVRKMISMNPWIAGGGNTTHVFTMSEVEKEKILSVVSKKVVVTGSIEDYYLLEKVADKNRIKQMIKEKYDIISDKVVIFAMPQLAEHNCVPWDIHRDNMVVIIKEILKIFDEVLISLHPKSQISDYVFLKQYGKISFLEERLRDVIAGADILAAVSSSSVVRWADIIDISAVVFEMEWLMKPVDEHVKKEIASRIGESVIKKETMPSPLWSIKNVTEEIYIAVNQ